jgi:hypothetical protein
MIAMRLRYSGKRQRGACEGVARCFLNMVGFFWMDFLGKVIRGPGFFSGKRKYSVLLSVRFVTTYKNWKWEREIKLCFYII